MKDHTRVVIVSVIDAVVAGLILIIGIIVLMLSDKMGVLKVAVSEIPTVFLILGITIVVYGVKRLIDDILKIFVK